MPFLGALAGSERKATSSGIWTSDADSIPVWIYQVPQIWKQITAGARYGILLRIELALQRTDTIEKYFWYNVTWIPFGFFMVFRRIKMWTDSMKEHYDSFFYILYTMEDTFLSTTLFSWPTILRVRKGCTLILNGWIHHLPSLWLY